MQKKSALMIVAVLLSLTLPILVAAAGGSLADLDVTPTSIYFITQAGAGEMTLRVSGPNGFFVEQDAADGFELPADAADGTYKWELRQVLQLSAETRAHLSETRDSVVLPEGDVQSGGFLVRGGIIRYDETTVEEPIAKADIHLDDTIIDGSACVGFDCVNGESFGFDTLRLEEGNLRIHFDDTSSSGSFPANDWRIVANDTSNGGANYLAIEDSTAGRIPFRVEAGARANGLVVESDGDVGIGTLNPAVDLEIVTGNTPTLRLQQDGSSGLTSQTWDVAGNEANFFVRDVTNGSKLSFRIRPGAPESSIDIQANGEVGIGTSNPGADLHVLGSGSSMSVNANTIAVFQNSSAAGTGSRVAIIAGNTGNSQVLFGDTDAEDAGRIVYRNSSNDMSFFTNDLEQMRILSSGDVGIGTNSPKARLHALDGGSPLAVASNTVAVFQNSTAASDGSRVSIISGSAGNAQLIFGDTDAEERGRITYRNNVDAMSFFTNGSEQVRLFSDGRLGLGGLTSVNAANDLEHSNGARLTTGGVWTDASSRALKQDITPLSSEAALEAFAALDPVTFAYKRNPEELHVGFIAEDVPEIVAMNDRQGLAPMDLVALLTKVVQEQQKTIGALAERLEQIENGAQP